MKIFSFAEKVTYETGSGERIRTIVKYFDLFGKKIPYKGSSTFQEGTAGGDAILLTRDQQVNFLRTVDK